MRVSAWVPFTGLRCVFGVVVMTAAVLFVHLVPRGTTQQEAVSAHSYVL